MLPALRRLPEVRRLIDQESYFVVHAPRQVGKTTALLLLARMPPRSCSSSGRTRTWTVSPSACASLACAAS
jgi:hypothetical protein